MAAKVSGIEYCLPNVSSPKPGKAGRTGHPPFCHAGEMEAGEDRCHTAFSECVMGLGSGPPGSLGFFILYILLSGNVPTLCS